MADWPRVYTIIGDPQHIDTYFRVDQVGRYERWDPIHGAWIHVPEPAARDWYSRAIETGDGVIPTEQEQIARLH